MRLINKRYENLILTYYAPRLGGRSTVEQVGGALAFSLVNSVKSLRTIVSRSLGLFGHDKPNYIIGLAVSLRLASCSQATTLKVDVAYSVILYPRHSKSPGAELMSKFLQLHSVKW